MKHKICVLLISLSFFANAQDKGWLITTKQDKDYTGIVVANGRIGILPSKDILKTRQIILNNVYDKESPLGVSRILKGIDFQDITLEIDGEVVSKKNTSKWRQILNMKEASFTTKFNFKNKASIKYTMYALRNVPYSGYLDISIKCRKNIKVKAIASIKTPKEYKEPLSTYRVLKDLETTLPILQTVAKSRLGKHTVAASGTFIWSGINSTREHQRPKLTHRKSSEYNHELSFEKELKKKETFNFSWTAAQCTTQDFEDPQTESERFVIFNLLTPKKSLLSEHKYLWKTLWEGDIIIEGDLQSQLDVRLALYHLYAFGRADSNLSIAPMGLSSQNYNGHIFWDTELWMYPPLLVLNQGIARSLLNYRSDRLEKAKQKAVSYGYKGAMFPWESDDTGEEATPSWALTGTFEHHITADIAIAFWNYYLVTKDKKWLKKRGYPMLKEIADFWVSRVSENNDGTFSIFNVVGANEFAPNVNDNAFTNGAATTALRYASNAARELKLTPKPRWKQVADGIIIHKFKDGTTKEHSKYRGERIKQADVNLLSYPLSIVKDKKTILKDLKYYEPKLAKEGPAMGKSIFSIIYARMGNSKTAYRLFKESYEPNKRPPFGALSETATATHPYFATGAGGMLQAVLFGFGGLHITEQGIVQKNGILPKQWKSLKIIIGKNKKSFIVK